MPEVTFADEVIECEEGANLREVLWRAEEGKPHNAPTDDLNCDGVGVCATCAVKVVEGDPPSKDILERVILTAHPTDADELRLACQIEVHEDLEVEKYPGLWGQHTDDDARFEDEDRPGEE